ncbi:MAG: glycosyltransferase [Deltaproteobacteria bacterium]|nr:glycosyltransferase [Deltaproteobacteria bacterium]
MHLTLRPSNIRANFLVVMAVAILSVGFWAYLNRPEEEPPWPKMIQGFSFSPMRMDESPLTDTFPTPEEIETDLALLAKKVHAIRTYSMEDVLAQIPSLAEKHDLNVTLGAWIDTRRENNEREVAELIRVAQQHRNVVRVIIGNEAILRGDVTVDELAVHLDRVRAELDRPVSTAEPWHVWIKYPQLAEHVDFVAVHMLPYWEGIHLDQAVEYIVQHMNSLRVLFPKKPIVMTEVGWPSNGRTRRSAVASPSNQAIFLRRFLDRAEQEEYIYYIMEAFDQPWKRDTEGAVGAYWGVYDVERHLKFPLQTPIVAIPQWHWLAGISVVIAIIMLSFLLLDSHTLKTRGRSFLAIIAYLASATAVWIIYKYVHQYLTLTSIIVGILVVTGMIGVIVVILTEAHEWAEALWSKERRRSLAKGSTCNVAAPFVSIHVPAYNEPPAMLIETLNALAALHYPAYEVVVIDNNTEDPAIWRPVEAHCQILGNQFRFFHIDHLTGFKAGALNCALQHTNSVTEIIAVIDSDYVVETNWLLDLVPQFENPRIAIVQAPQDYRDAHRNAFKAVCHAEYSGFFFIGMITRNDRNAIIQHGTMTLVRKSVLETVGSWAAWCITEDAELGLRVFEQGYEAIYIPTSYGRGVMPDTFLDYKRQRFRWAYGAMQILKQHLRSLIGVQASALTYGQKYHFIAGWLPWMADAANLVFNVAAVCWSAAMLSLPKRVDPPLAEFSLFPIALFSFKIGKLIYLYRARIRAPFRKICGAALAGIALSHTIAIAVLQGITTSSVPFFRTPKMTATSHLLRTLAAIRAEVFFFFTLLGAAMALVYQQGLLTLDMHAWILVLMIQSIPYLATMIVALLSVIPRLPARLFDRTDSHHLENC